MFVQTTATRKIANLDKRIRAIAGGTSASKTISILLILIHLAQTDKTAKVTHIVSESLPHLKLAAMADFLRIMKEHRYYKEDRWSRTDYIYTFESGSTFQFYGADNVDKVHGPRRDRLFVNEANHIPYNSFDQMEVRTNEIIFLDWNPTNEFWFYTEVLPHREKDVDFISLTYKDNEALPASIVASIESRMHKKSWWNIYGLGQLGEAEGKIYSDWQIIDEIPFEARIERRGLDFGYTNDPTTIVDVYYYNGGYIVDEQLYRTGMKNRQIADFILALHNPDTLVKADSAEPKSIDEIAEFGVTILPVTKGQDSVRQGIQRVQSEKISVTSRSHNLIKEYRNYLWAVDRITGAITNTPEDGFDHCLDALRYAFEGYRDIDPRIFDAFRQQQQRAIAGMV